MLKKQHTKALETHDANLSAVEGRVSDRESEIARAELRDDVA